jgi:hypothetical protein
MTSFDPLSSTSDDYSVDKVYSKANDTSGAQDIRLDVKYFPRKCLFDKTMYFAIMSWLIGPGKPYKHFLEFLRDAVYHRWRYWVAKGDIPYSPTISMTYENDRRAARRLDFEAAVSALEDSLRAARHDPVETMMLTTRAKEMIAEVQRECPDIAYHINHIAGA